MGDVGDADDDGAEVGIVEGVGEGGVLLVGLMVGGEAVGGDVVTEGGVAVLVVGGEAIEGTGDDAGDWDRVAVARKRRRTKEQSTTFREAML
ncbi:hypothetical protein MLD38_019701 [Melastoma candidum]|uniref:Uncharacterized protein n=1 Tax=Melastoma candidum TaxID=119954 RepID=A0ACB9QXU2_9MYRT|nr:hypothetical protein MLD38_019701 [Melastoma candidum]